jgi:hypothetical protein
MDFMAQLRLARRVNKTLTVKIGDTAEEEWRVLNIIPFTHPGDLQGIQLSFDAGAETFENKFNVANGSWLLPKLFNQGGYDAAQVVVGSSQPKILVRFAQVTRGPTHTLKLEYMLKLTDSLVALGFEIEDVDIVFVVPAGKCESFKLGSTSGDLRSWNVKSNHPPSKDDIRVAGLKRS